MENKERKVGTVSRGIRCPIIRQGDDLATIVTDSVLEAAESEGFELRDKDVISITESIVARAQGNYASVEDIATDVSYEDVNVKYMATANVSDKKEVEKSGISGIIDNFA